MVLWKDWGILDGQRHTVKPFEDRVVSFLFDPPEKMSSTNPTVWENEFILKKKHQRGESVGSPQYFCLPGTPLF